MMPMENWYQDNAPAFIAATAQLDLSELYARFLPLVPLLPPQGQILDFGCGSGRDSLAFARAGFAVLGLDPCAAFVAHLRQDSEQHGLTERLQARLGSVEALAADERFDGIWACASLLHLPKAELPAVLARLAGALKPGGVLYASFKHGRFAGERNGRYFTDLEPEAAQALIAATPGLVLREIWQTEDLRPERVESWVNVLAQRLDV
jgi:2-polyprenyl-3-methyl-5-hydroxy-6-metoxy-1,4-benzoquinol methylase